MKYMLMMHTGQDVDQGILAWSPEDVKRMIEFQLSFDQDLRDRGEMVFNEGLTFPDQARIVRADGTGAPVVTDGPFPESKEFLDRVLDRRRRRAPSAPYEIAAKASAAPGRTASRCSIPIEVRQVERAPPVDA